MTEEKVWMIVALCITMIAVTLILCLNYTSWIALEKGYCQTTAVGSGDKFWVKCK